MCTDYPVFPPASHPAILVISDEIQVGILLRRTFAGKLSIIVSPSLASGLDRMRDQRVAAVMVNTSLPVLSAEEVLPRIRQALGDVLVLGFDPSSKSDSPQPLSDEAMCEMEKVLEDLVNRAPSAAVSLQLQEVKPERSLRLSTDVWPRLPLRMEEPLPLELLAMIMGHRDSVNAGSGSGGGSGISSAAQISAGGGGGAVTAGGPQSPSVSGGGNGVAAGIGSGPLQSIRAHAPALELASSDLEPKIPLPTPFLRDEAMQLEQANEFDLMDGVRCRLTGRVRRLSTNFLVGEVVSQAHFRAEDWQESEIIVRFGKQAAYRGPARLTKLVNTGNSLVSEWALLGEWPRPQSETTSTGASTQVFNPFLDRVRLLGRVGDVFKAVVADVTAVLEEAKQALDRVEVTLIPYPGESPQEAQMRVLPELRKTLFPVLNDVFSRFEACSAAVPEELEAAHHLLVRQHLHPYLLCSPFIQHIYSKPLGYAGDYGALQKLLQDPYEGHTLFARLINAWLVLCPAGEAYRHRIQTLVTTLHDQATICRKEGRPLRVLSLGCGAGVEMAQFISTDDLSTDAEITMVDFNETTLSEALQNVRRAADTSWRQVKCKVVMRSVQGVVADAARMERSGLTSFGEVVRLGGYDLVCCTGLFDYFSDRVCARLVSIFYESLAPGGTALICNFTPDNPIRHLMRLVLDWKLIHRTASQVRALAPPNISADQCRISLSPKGVEAYLHVTKAVP